MRYYTFILKSPGDTLYLDSLEEDVDRSIDINRESLLDVRMIDDGFAITIYRLRGNHKELQGVLEDHDKVESYEVFGESDKDNSFYVYLRFKPDGHVKNLMDISDRHGLMMERPSHFLNPSTLEVTAIGRSEDIQDAYPEFLDEIKGYRIKLEQVGEYNPTDNKAMASLTDRQKEIITTAVDLGYYSIPRKATHEDVAAEVGCSASTAGEHLRKAESRLIPQIVR